MSRYESDQKIRQMLLQQMDRAEQDLSAFFREQGMDMNKLGKAMDGFAKNILPLPDQAACRAGCTFCCHLRVGASIPETLVAYSGLNRCLPQGEIDSVRARITQAAGDALDEHWWRKEKMACPFLDSLGRCMIYGLRPFSCRAYHSTDARICQKGYDTGKEVKVPCFPLYRSFTDMYATVFIRAAAQRGLASFQVGFIKALALLFEDDRIIDKWLLGEDVFCPARL